MYLSDIDDGQLGKLKIGKALKKVGKGLKKVVKTVAPFAPAAIGIAATAGILSSKKKKKKAKKQAADAAAALAQQTVVAPQVSAETAATANMIPANVSEPAPVINNSPAPAAPVTAASTARKKKKKKGSASPKLTDSTDSLSAFLQAAQGVAPQQQVMQPASPGYSESNYAPPANNLVDNAAAGEPAEKPGISTPVIIAGVAGLGLLALAMSGKRRKG